MPNRDPRDTREACPSLGELFDDARRGRAPAGELGRRSLPEAEEQEGGAGTTRQAAEQRAARAAHVLSCPSCRAARRWVEKLVTALEIGRLPEPPEALVRAAMERATAAVRAAPRRAAWLDLEPAVDVPESGLVAGVRAGGRPPDRRLYSAPPADLDLEVRALDLEEPRLEITGQLLLRGEPPPADVIAALWSADGGAVGAEGDVTGLFTFTGVKPATYRLTLWLPGAGLGLRVDELDLRATAH